MSSPKVGTPAGGERLSLGQSTLSTASKPLHSLPNLAAALPSSSAADDPHSAATLINQDTLLLATPPPNYVDSQAWHLLATEMVYSLVYSSRHASKKQRLARQQLADAGIAPLGDTTDPSTHHSGQDGQGAAAELDAMVSARLEAIGFHVGSNLAEHLSRERARFSETLDVLKFICKELWTTIWGKQVDNLRTNHRGVYVLQDNAFKPLCAMSTSRGAQETAREVKLFLSYPVGIVRGALAQLDVPSAVVAETSQAPQCTFHVKTQRAAAATSAAGP
ncbi:uncharacterized protein PFL1_00875 [Pseudozyma flocculosa PF-1]|uniref:Related to TRS33 - subunit of the transport protein particle complex n=1 Tax=Pseudozyma flocculosa TaxID=84751 RepID=A0A5C3F3J3_9BASI|nr:uncharacterized protein PFL1_00875 [Pseudozyma flocculosa PF-1]EPQ31542.1 hypothetical protein PFL1_00875 [Pseudozyma flocculosa PF-1]SPO38670.1 related to TRS33 - subunit of the transport protein particle complex [Pseudozyma flocculosa]